MNYEAGRRSQEGLEPPAVPGLVLFSLLKAGAERTPGNLRRAPSWGAADTWGQHEDSRRPWQIGKKPEVNRLKSNQDKCQAPRLGGNQAKQKCEMGGAWLGRRWEGDRRLG